MTTTVTTGSAEPELKWFAFTLRIADPIVDAHPLKLYFPFDGRITKVVSQTRSSTGTDTVTFSIMVAGVDLTDYQDLVSTQSLGIEYTDGTDSAINDIDQGEALEVDITALGGTGHTYFDVEVQGYLR